MNISHFRFSLFKLKIFGEIVTTIFYSMYVMCAILFTCTCEIARQRQLVARSQILFHYVNRKCLRF